MYSISRAVNVGAELNVYGNVRGPYHDFCFIYIKVEFRCDAGYVT